MILGKGDSKMTKNIQREAINDVEEKRTTLSLSLTVSDKKALKMMAMEQDTTIAAIIHEWIIEHIESADGGM